MLLMHSSIPKNCAAAVSLAIPALFALGCCAHRSAPATAPADSAKSEVTHSIDRPLNGVGSTAAADSSYFEVTEAQSATAVIAPAAAAATQPSQGSVKGTVTFQQDGNDVKVTADLTGLTPGEHGFHIHDKGDLSAPDLSSAGGHYNPAHARHGGPTSEHHHAGDLGNITADDKGAAHYNITLPNMKVADLIGHSVIVHAKADDLKSDPAGNAGARVAGGKIEAATPEKVR